VVVWGFIGGGEWGQGGVVVVGIGGGGGGIELLCV